jgi:hypothetical protein
MTDALLFKVQSEQEGIIWIRIGEDKLMLN